MSRVISKTTRSPAEIFDFLGVWVVIGNSSAGFCEILISDEMRLFQRSHFSRFFRNVTSDFFGSAKTVHAGQPVVYRRCRLYTVLQYIVLYTTTSPWTGFSDVPVAKVTVDQRLLHFHVRKNVFFSIPNHFNITNYMLC